MTTFVPSRHLGAIVLLGSLVFFLPRPASAQAPGNFEVGIQVPVARSGEFDAFDAGVGGRFAWRPASAIGLEGEINFYPTEFTGPLPFSKTRIEGLFGVTVGPSFGAFRPFARVRSGFLSFLGRSVPYPCILIYPPPLSCELASGQTLPAVDIGGGVEIFTSGRVFIRADVGDRMVKYSGPVISADRKISMDGFFSHDFRFATGAGLRF